MSKSNRLGINQFPYLTLGQRIWSRTKLTPTGCIEWVGHMHKSGYGVLGYQGTVHWAHRIVYQYLRMLERTHCKSGHPFGDATRTRGERTERLCITCKHESERRSSVKRSERRRNARVAAGKRADWYLGASR